MFFGWVVWPYSGKKKPILIPADRPTTETATKAPAGPKPQQQPPPSALPPTPPKQKEASTNALAAPKPRPPPPPPLQPQPQPPPFPQPPPDEASQPIPPAVVPPIMGSPCPLAAATSTNIMAPCISDGSRKRGRDEDGMTAVPVHRLRVLSEAFERFEGSALEMVTHCVRIGHHLQTEAEVLRVTGIAIDRLLDGPT